ncbi:hypothetical protein [Pseudoxanthomonas winnipegensis]|uniref:hypothetical protein n=1 Tax=Pseudoxanthomonas winnipegensis TaxID=2480810 RepID=UPI00102DF344|nr:hypothetical protein [Pseudoxanthomonas winnipegensis]
MLSSIKSRCNAKGQPLGVLWVDVFTLGGVVGGVGCLGMSAPLDEKSQISHPCANHEHGGQGFLGGFTDGEFLANS